MKFGQWSMGVRGWPRRRAPQLVFPLVAALACGSESSSESGPVGGQHEDPDFSSQALLQNLGERVIASYEDFAGAAEQLEASTEAWAGSLDEADRRDAQQAWRDAMVVWQPSELYRFGPGGEPTTVYGGQGLGDTIYSWSLSVNPCRVDQETLEDAFMDPEALAAEAVNVRGLDALEYLLFNDSTDNACATNLSINTDGLWADRLDEVPQLRADYAAALAREVRTNADALLAAWDPDEGDFLEQLVGAGEPSSVYPSLGAAFVDIGGAMLYIDQQTKERKVAIPAGIAGCETATCPESVESPFAMVSTQNIRGNLTGLHLLFVGNLPDQEEAYGLDDQLRDYGADATAEAMAIDLQAAIDSADALEEDTLVESLEQSLDQVQDLYDALVVLTGEIKTELVRDLGIDLTAPGAGDAD